MTDETEDLLARLDGGLVEYDKRWSGDTHSDKGGPVDYEATDAIMRKAAALIRAKDAEIARLVAERDALLSRAFDDGQALANLADAEAALDTERTARLAAEARVGDASAAWEDFKASSTSQDHYAAVARLDAALPPPRPTMTDWPLEEGSGSIIVGKPKEKPHD